MGNLIEWHQGRGLEINTLNVGKGQTKTNGAWFGDTVCNILIFYKIYKYTKWSEVV